MVLLNHQREKLGFRCGSIQRLAKRLRLGPLPLVKILYFRKIILDQYKKNDLNHELISFIHFTIIRTFKNIVQNTIILTKNVLQIRLTE